MPNRYQKSSVPSLRRATALSIAALAAGTLGTFGIAQVAGASSSTAVKVTTNKTWGPILTLGDGDTLYRLTADKTNKSVCTGACATAWPPALLASGQKTPVGTGVKGLGTIARAGGNLQITYQGIPLYTFVGDHKAGQVNGNVKDTWGQWWTVNPSHPLAAAKKTTSSSSGSGSTNTTAGAGGGGVAY